jgi:hypothetical protein
MNQTSPSLDDISDIIQEEFNYLDKLVGSRTKRKRAITDLPQLARDLYLVADIVAITCDSGTAAWIHYHHDEPGWMDCAVDAFTRIGYPQVSEGIRSCLAVYLSKRGSMTHKDDEVPSNFIMEHEHEIMRSLYAYLVKHKYLFASPDT